jgi:hypothetical protein
MSSTNTSTETYSVTDIEIVMRRVSADLVMIATSTGAITEAKAKEYAHDIEFLAKNGYLKFVDITLLNLGVEEKAVRFTVDAESGTLTMSRPGGVLWPKVSFPSLRVVVSYTDAYTDDARSKTAGKLKVGWVANFDDISHSCLTAGDGRSYSSNNYGIQRKDFSK